MRRFIRSIGPAKLTLAAFDLLVLTFVAAVILFVRSRFFGYTVSLNEFLFFACSTLVAIGIFREFQLYRNKLFSTGADQIVLLGKAMLWVGIVQIFAIFLIKNKSLLDYSRGHVLLFLVGGWLGLSLMRVAFYRHVHVKYFGGRPNARRVVIIGAGRAGQSLAARIMETPQLGLNIAGFVDDDKTLNGLHLFGRPIVGGVEGIARHIKQLGVEELFIAINSVEYSRLLEIIEACRATNLPVTITADHFRIVRDNIGTSEFPCIESLTLRPHKFEFPHRTLKELIDVVGAAIMLLLLAPLFTAMSIAVKLSSKGPIFYRTQVVGKNGKLFTWYKFRTMVVDGDEDQHRDLVEKIIKENTSTRKLQSDPRITSIGAILRKYSLDELPQIINVLRGEMSLIGPRPCLPYEYQHFDEWHRRRFAVTPGITGLWQVFGRNRHDVTFNDSIILDLYYIQNYSLWLDVKIILKTIPVVLFGRGGA
ncbi:MAG: Lipopolysaccharide synthesis sugar transferase [Chlorobi bacterium]|nr:Lipopolysaccharide synthesis sugar transferase [Chlorobiota bacterium]